MNGSKLSFGLSTVASIPSTRFSTFTVPFVSWGVGPVNQCLRVPLNPSSVTAPNDVCLAMIDVNRPRQSVQPLTSPVPQLKGKDVGGGTDLKYHAVFARTMDCASGDKEMIMLTSRKLVHVLCCPKRRSAILCHAQVADHCFGIDTRLQTQIHASVCASIQQIV